MRELSPNPKKRWKCKLCGFASKDWTDLVIHAEETPDEAHQELFSDFEDKQTDAMIEGEMEWIEENFDKVK